MARGRAERARAAGRGRQSIGGGDGLPSARDGRAALVPPRAGAPAPWRRRAHVADAPRRALRRARTGCSSPPGAGTGPSRSSSRGAAPGDGHVRVVDPRGVDVGAVLPELAGLAVRVAARVGGARRRAGRRRRARPGRRPGAPGAALRAARAAGGVPRVRPAAPRRQVAARAAAREAAGGAAARPAAGRRGRDGPGDHRRRAARSTRRSRRRASPGCWRGAGLSPYLPGVRSRLWRSILARSPGTSPPASPSRRPGSSADVDADVVPEGTAPVLALFRRLPFAEDSTARSGSRSSRSAPRRVARD